jgi:hypothetical protein
MRRRRSHLAVFIALATSLVVSIATTGSAATQTKSKATVTLAGTAPVTVTGWGFAPRERVSVRLSFANDVFSRVARTSAKGRFALQFPGAAPTLDECTQSVFVFATGNRSGRSATFRVRSIQIPPPCGIAPQP